MSLDFPNFVGRVKSLLLKFGGEEAQASVVMKENESFGEIGSVPLLPQVSHHLQFFFHLQIELNALTALAFVEMRDEFWPRSRGGISCTV